MSTRKKATKTHRASTKNKKNRVIAGLLAIFLGDFGIHKFYIGKMAIGLLYLVFCWTGIPAVVGLIEGVLYLITDDSTFRKKYC